MGIDSCPLGAPSDGEMPPGAAVAIVGAPSDDKMPPGASILLSVSPAEVIILLGASFGSDNGAPWTDSTDPGAGLEVSISATVVFVGGGELVEICTPSVGRRPPGAISKECGIHGVRF